jgi:PPP family 3-phenylpropionic acid transporter
MAAVYVALFAFAGLHLPFWPVWLESRGLDAVEIGLLIAVGRWVIVIASPIIAQFADRSGERRRPLIVLAVAVLASYALFLVTENYWHFLAVTVLAAVFQGAMVPLNESLTMMGVRAGRVDYGRVRLWGSLSFIAATMLGGLLLENLPEQVILWAVLGAIASVLVAATMLPDLRVRPSPLRLGAIPRLAKHPIFATFLLAVALLQGSHAVVYAYGSLHWRAAGISDAMIGWLWAEGVIAEILLFAAGAAVVRRLGPGGLLGLVAVAGVVRWTVLGLSVDPIVLMAAQVLHGFTFGAAHLAAMTFITRATPASVSATAQSLYSALAMGATFAVVLPFAAPLYAATGGNAFFFMAGLSAAGGVAAFLLTRRWRDAEIGI